MGVTFGDVVVEMAGTDTVRAVIRSLLLERAKLAVGERMANGLDVDPQLSAHLSGQVDRFEGLLEERLAVDLDRWVDDILGIFEFANLREPKVDEISDEIFRLMQEEVASH